MNTLYKLYALFYLIFSRCLDIIHADNIEFLGAQKSFILSLPIKQIKSQNNFAPITENFYIGTPSQNFTVLVNLHEMHTDILNQTVSNCNFNPSYNINSNTLTKDNLIKNVDTIFGSGYFRGANESINVTLKNHPDEKNNTEINFVNYSFRLIERIFRCSKIISNGVIGLGYNNQFMLNMKSSGHINHNVYSAELSSDKQILELSIGDISENLKRLEDKFSYCDIVHFNFVNEYWGCNADIYLRTKNKKKGIKGQTVLFYQILDEDYNDAAVIYFAGMKDKYVEFLIDGLLDNNPKCNFDTSLQMIVCDIDVDLKSLPNLLFVMNDITYVFKPENLFYIDENLNKNVLKVKFPDANYNHIKFNQHFLFSNNISVIVNSDKKQVGFYGFNTHKYRGEDDDGNEDDGESDFWTVVAVNIIILFVVGIAYGIYHFLFKNRNAGGISTEYFRR